MNVIVFPTTGSILFHSSLDSVQNAFVISGIFYINSWLSHLNSNCLPFSLPKMLRNEYMYNWIVHLLCEAGIKIVPWPALQRFLLCALWWDESRVGVSVQPLHAALERSALQLPTPPGCITIPALFQSSPADLQQVPCPSLWFGSHGSFVTYKFSCFQRKLYVIQHLEGLWSLSQSQLL